MATEISVEESVKDLINNHMTEEELKENLLYYILELPEDEQKHFAGMGVTKMGMYSNLDYQKARVVWDEPKLQLKVEVKDGN